MVDLNTVFLQASNALEMTIREKFQIFGKYSLLDDTVGTIACLVVIGYDTVGTKTSLA